MPPCPVYVRLALDANLVSLTLKSFAIDSTRADEETRVRAAGVCFTLKTRSGKIGLIFSLDWYLSFVRIAFVLQSLAKATRQCILAEYAHTYHHHHHHH